jgi:hypothetical protein
LNITWTTSRSTHPKQSEEAQEDFKKLQIRAKPNRTSMEWAAPASFSFVSVNFLYSTSVLSNYFTLHALFCFFYLIKPINSMVYRFGINIAYC